MADVAKKATIAFKRAGDVVLVVGETRGHLGQSIYLREIEGREEGGAPPVDLAAEKRNGDFVRGLIADGSVDTVHDCSDGGILVAVAEMALKGGIGASIGAAGGNEAVPFFFGEDQARYVLAVPFKTAEAIIKQAAKAGVTVAELGQTGGDALVVNDADRVDLAALRTAHEGWFPALMAGEEIPPTN
jgi:phosphoribosylformylglycinamidine synthase